MSYKKTVRKIFHDAIQEGDWANIRRVYKAIVGEEAPRPPANTQQKTLDDVLSQELSPLRRASNPLDQPLDDEPMHQVEESPRDANHEEDLIVDEPAMVATPQILIPDSLPISVPDDDPTSEFHIQQDTFSGGGHTDEDGKHFCRKESMDVYADKRPNRFRDNGKAFAKEKVTNDPDNAALGIQSIRPRSQRDGEVGVDTSKTAAVTCGLCSKQEVVAASLAVGYNTKPEHNTYRCNECNSPAGRAKIMRQQRNDELNGR